ncbi:S-layer homology domain-containing protein [Oscillibacter sp. MSJ-2]|uniref:S-layer homology domain-containing protein n=1 Tax=Dysosmobacter acutus TaxID=2841504 RepID=A0ABS6F6P0_9FIRM|nr:S-layer homology domain-containing protein [Dysosmobacter acutus]MBU5625953.1 S-layer homology domain-containing protein [Dysosmobacter acutus]
MRKFLCRATSLILAAVLASASLSAAASYAMGDDLTSVSTGLHEQTQLNTSVFWSSAYSDLRTENVVTYVPSESVTPIVTYGGAITQRSTVSATAKALEAQGYRVVAGINGDFYNTGNGVPIGLVITEGQIRTGASAYHAIGFCADGTAVLGKPGIKYSVDLGQNASGQTVVRSIADVNKARLSEGGIYLYTYDFNARHTNGTTEPGVDVVCSIVEGSLSIGTEMTLQVEQVLTDASATAVGADSVVLSANNKTGAYYTDALKNLMPGQTLTLSVTASDTRWNDVEYAVGALYSLVSGGVVASSLPSGQAPRTAIGQKADGTLVFYTVDGRKSGHSIGATLSQVGQRMVELGCVTALGLDGGGSTTLSVTSPDTTSASTINSPSEGSERSVSNHVFLVASSSSTGILSHYYVKPESSYALTGSTVKVSASGVDTNYIPMDAGYDLSSTDGTVENGAVVLPAYSGDVTVTASGDGRSGSAVIHTVDTVDSLSISGPAGALSAVTIAPGESVQLIPKATYNHLSLFSSASAYTWSISGDVGTVDADGKFTASLQPATGTLTVSGGGKSVSVPIRVTSLSLNTLEDFEEGLPDWSASTSGTALERNTNVETVRFGKASGALSYALDEATSSASLFLTSLHFKANYNRLNLWVYGDGSGNTLSATTFDGVNYGSVTLSTLDFTGWKQLSVKLPEGAASVTDLTVSGTTPSGTIYLDQIVCSYNDIVDQTAPAVTASLAGTALSGAVSDEVDGLLPKANISVTVDGKAVSFNYNESTGAVSATVAVGDGNGHRVSIIATDASGNVRRASADAASTAQAPHFSDTANYWASAYVDYLYTSGITTGYADGTFRPSRNISRQEFAVMLYRYLGLSASQYESVELPFADLGQIGDFALTAVKALYTEGILNGTMGSDGRLYFNPASSITRAQAAAMMGRTQPKGYTESALSFTDTAAIPAYASYYVSTMVSQGVISGYEDGSFKPNSPISRGQMAKILYNLL